MKLLKLDVTHELIGSKALNLKVIERSGCKVPETFVLYDDHISSSMIERKKGDILVSIKEGLSEDKMYAVRSAKGIEDSIESSFAGIFHSVLNVKRKNIYEALVEVAKSYENIRYTERESNDYMAFDHKRQVKDAILIQEMIQPAYSGVLFTRNPVNNRDEMVAEMVSGLGSQLDQEGVNPYRIIFAKGKMTFDERLNETGFQWISRVFAEANKISKLFGEAIDCEWVYDGKDIYWLQVRPITALSDTVVYDRTILKGHFKEMLRPMDYEIGVPVITSAFIRIVHEVDSTVEVMPHTLSKIFYYRTYFDRMSILQIMDELGVSPKNLKILQNFNGEYMKKGFVLSPRMFFKIGGWIDFHTKAKQRLAVIKETMSIYEKKSETIRVKIQQARNEERCTDILDDLKEHLIDGEYYTLIAIIRKKEKILDEIRMHVNTARDLFHLLMERWGKLLVDKGYLSTVDDIYYLTVNELYLDVDNVNTPALIQSKIKRQRKLFNRCHKYSMPDVIYGVEDLFMSDDESKVKHLTGTAVSKGRKSGRVKVITLDDDFETIDSDEIVIVPYSDMVFEPVLARASAVMMKSGGILSHLAILAREMGTPAVTSVEEIDSIKDGMEVFLDGYIGEVTVIDKDAKVFMYKGVDHEDVES